MKKWMLIIFLSALIIIVSAVLCGLLYQFIRTKLEENRFPAPGKLVDVGGYKLHINQSGSETGLPTVILDAGLGGCSLHWPAVQKAIEGFARVCSYDRAGMGWSDVSLKPRTSKVIVEELHVLLRNSNILPPYILVGHSLGGINMRLYANTYPEDVFGVVLVDSTHEKLLELLALVEEKFAKIDPKKAFLTRVKTYIFKSRFFRYVGLLRLMNTLGIKKLTCVPEALKGQMIAKTCTLKSFNTLFSEGEYIKQSCKQVEQSSNSLVNKPLTVITAAKRPNDGSEIAQEVVAIVEKCQKEFVALSRKGKQLIAENSGHHVNWDQPEIIVEAVREMVNGYNAEKAKQN